MAGKYATQTTVTVSASKGEIEQVLKRYGASQFLSGWDADRAMIGFTIEGRQVRMSITLPDRKAPEIGSNRHRKTASA